MTFFEYETRVLKLGEEETDEEVPTRESKERETAELGNLLRYCAVRSNKLGLSLNAIAYLNLERLQREAEHV